MASSLRHRGPDDEGAWVDSSCGLAFGFQRLSIIDLSATGHQPMHSPSGRYTIVFNGEVYNHEELGAELRKLGHVFRGHSDTEVLLAAFEEWGLEGAVANFIGMFAIAVWDAEEHCLWLLRDRLGIKPLFIFFREGLLAFASELRAFLQLDEFTAELDLEALAQYLRYLYVPAPRSILRGVSKLLPGHLLEVRTPSGPLPSSRPYWSVQDLACRDRHALIEYDDRKAVDTLDSLMSDAVRLRMRADVPLGAFLSGGVDSSTVVALMQESSPWPVRTFTIGFDVDRHDESKDAEAVARHLGTDHQAISFGARDALDLIPSLPEVFDEPFADPSQLPTYLICRAARRELTVAVSGDGGDELFAGYNRYTAGSWLIPRLSRLPAGLRNLLASGVTTVQPATWDRLQAVVAGIVRRDTRLLGDKLYKLSDMLRAGSSGEMYEALISAWQGPPIDAGNGLRPDPSTHRTPSALSLLEQMMLKDQYTYLPDDLLAKVDRASMSVGLEVRVPILDHRIVEFSWNLPLRFKLRGNQNKWLLRQVLARRVPEHLTNRPKVGFSIPLAEWLRGPLRAWADAQLDPDRLAEVPGLHAAVIRSVWTDFLEGRNNQQLGLWAVLMFESWRQRWVGL